MIMIMLLAILSAPLTGIAISSEEWIIRSLYFFHNFCGYDSHFIVHKFPIFQNRKLKVNAFNIEKYLQIE